MHMELKTEFLQTLQLLINTPSVVGAEHSFMLLIKRELETLNIKVNLYEGLLEAQGSNPTGVILTSHIDRHGLVCTGPNEFQYASFTTRFKGDLDGKSRSEQLLASIENRFLEEKVIAYSPWSGSYIGQGTIKESHICPIRNNLIFTLKGLENVDPGTPIAYNDALTIDGPWIRSQLDNVLSAAIIITLYKRGFQGRALFTCEEEAGRSWRYLLSYFQRKEEHTDMLLVLDTSPFDSPTEASAQDLVLRNKDLYGQFNPTLTQSIVSICDTHGISYRKKDEFIEQKNARFKNGESKQSIGVTELGRLIQGGKNTLSGTTLQFPTFDYHTSNESYNLNSLPQTFMVLEELISTYQAVEA